MALGEDNYQEEVWQQILTGKNVPETIEILIKAKVAGVTFADDYGSVNGPFLSPALFQRHIMPQLRRMVACFRQMGAPVMMHSDGNLRPLLEGIVEGTEINAYHPIERGAGMDLKQVKDRYGGRLCLIGNVGIVDHRDHRTSGTITHHRFE